MRHAVCTLYAMEVGLVALGLAPALVLLLQGGRLVWPFIFLVGAFIVILLLETVNYIEHYGLVRRPNDTGSYEKVMPVHSWNSNHVIGRMMLFELSRHSDHHYKASRKYQILRHHDDAPQMPFDYLYNMLLALFPPLWYRTMDPLISGDQSESKSLVALFFILFVMSLGLGVHQFL